MAENQIEKIRKNLLNPDLSRFSTKVSANKLASLEIGVFGEAGAGKSTFINTVIKSFQKRDDVLPFANADTRNALVHGTKNYEEFKLQEEKFRISIYDSRGFNFINEEEDVEIFKFIFGYGSTGYMSRRHDTFSPEDRKLLDSYGPSFTNNKTSRPLNAIVLCISSTAQEAILKKMEKIVNSLRTIQYNSFLVVVTKLGSSGETKDVVTTRIATALNLGIEKIKVINSYTERLPAYNAECETTALEVVNECLVLAGTSPEFKLSWRKKLRLMLKQHQDSYYFLSKNWQGVLIALLSVIIMLMWLIYIPSQVDRTTVPGGSGGKQ